MTKNCDNCGRPISNQSNTPFANSILEINKIAEDKTITPEKLNLCDICTVGIYYSLEEMKKLNKKDKLVSDEFTN
jgi:H2-forming N5,N10-methylenetetrahydromethanopterin dehydrogenase-like enzyme